MRRLQAALLILVLALAVLALSQGPASAQDGNAVAGQNTALYLPLVMNRSGRQNPVLYLPLVFDRSGYVSPFGYEIYKPDQIFNQQTRNHARALGASWTRINTVSWREVQPTQGAPYNWSVLAEFEGVLAVANELNLIPIVVVDDYPQWATLNDPFPTSCGALREDRFGDFANFMRALVERYKGAPYNVQYWELGNEPDVDPTLVLPDNVFGCWGDIDAPNYGGEHYGNMLKVVTPAIRAADPQAKVLIGSLLLATPNSSPGQGKPENFLRGILSVGAAPDFDILGYHAYVTSALNVSDVDLYGPPPSNTNIWTDLGGFTLGKARYLRAVMAEFGVSKPLFLTEAGFRCLPSYPRCANPGPNYTQEFLEPQADYLVRTYVRAMAEGIEQITWFTLNGPGWDDSGLLNSRRTPRPAYVAYRELTNQSQLGETRPVGVDYGGNIEAYRFRRSTIVVDVLWSRNGSQTQVDVPEAQFVDAYDRNGARITPQMVDGQARFSVGASPIYIHRRP